MSSVCVICGKECGNNGLRAMHFRWKHNGGNRGVYPVRRAK